MIPRLNKPKQSTSYRSWPDPAARATGELFEGRPRFRKMIVFTDAQLFDSLGAGWSKEWLLNGLLALQEVTRFHYLDGSLPYGITPLRDTPVPIAPGWVVLGPIVDGEPRSVVTCGIRGDSISSHGLSGNLAQVVINDTESSVYQGLSSEAAGKKRSEDAAALMAAQALGADIYVTSRDYLLERRDRFAREVTVVNVDEALTVIGLYLRSQGRYVTCNAAPVGSTEEFGQTIYFRMGVWELLPSWWRWRTAIVQHGALTSRRGTQGLEFTVIQRLQSVLRERDHLHVLVNSPQDAVSDGEVLTSVDTILTQMMAACDVTARVAFLVVRPDIGFRQSGWQRATFVDKVRLKAPQLAAIFDRGDKAWSTMLLLATLRNTIHDVAIGAVGIADTGTYRRDRVALQISDDTSSGTESVLTLIQTLGGASEWAVERFYDDELLFDPRVLVEKLLLLVIEILNLVMDRTPVETLSGVSLSETDVEVPSSTKVAFFTQMNRQSIRWQLGI